MSEEMQPIDPVTAAMLMGQVPDPCEPIIEISHKVLARLLDVVEFGDQLERVEKDRLLAHLKEVLAADQPELWAMHSPGPCEVHPMISKEEAEHQASELLALCKKQFPAIPITVNVIPSPFSPLEHFEILAGELNEQVTDLRKALEKKTADTPAPVSPTLHAIVLPMPVMPEQPEDAIDDSWMDGYNAALRMREECMRAIEAAGLAAPAVVNQQLTTAASDVLAERQRQVSAEGWTPEHDDEHNGGELAAAAAAYALHAADRLHPYSQGDGGDEAPSCWPWHDEIAGRGEGPEKTKPAWWKPGTPRRNLIKASALILAEIERIDRNLLDSGEHRQLFAYQVGDNDIVAAYDPAGAIKVLFDFAGYGDDFDEHDVELISDKVLDNTEVFDQDEGKIVTLEKTLRQELAELTEPAYMLGWE